MIKIKYPDKIQNFEKDYLNIFNFKLKKCFGKDIKHFLTMPIEEIIAYKINNNSKLEKSKITLKNIFNYELYQTEISEFFMKYQKELNLSTCYYCNINYIYSFESKYCNILDFILYSSKSELEKVGLIGDKTSKKLINYRSSNQINSLSDIPKNILSRPRKDAIEKHTSNMKYNHFTLDHILEQSEYPLFSLSLYNLIPCCSTCNSKYKHAKTLVKDLNDLKFIPSYKKINFNKEVKFKLFFNNICKVTKEINPNKIKIVLNSNDLRYRKFISTFKLYNRYQNHANQIENLIQNKKKYSETYINNIANTLNKSPIEIKKDIFGKEIFEGEISDFPLTKLKRDVWDIISKKYVIIK